MSELKTLQEDFEDFFENNLCGFVIADGQGLIVRANAKLATWIGVNPAELTGKRFSDLLAIGGKIYYETHLWPLLRMQGFFDEVMLELNIAESKKLRVLANAFERRDSDGTPCFIRYTIVKATDRIQYEQNLQQAKAITEIELQKEKENVALREQLIAVLGHDLRNPLSAMAMASELLEDSSEKERTNLLTMLRRSVLRMTELVGNIMDFARTRLGQTIILHMEEIPLEPVLRQVVHELNLIYPHREIITTYNLESMVKCDPHRIAQLVSNLLANALTHGAPDTPVHLNAIQHEKNLEINVCNKGKPIPPELKEHVFAPYTRVNGPSKNGLGLGLYISSEIARAHSGILSFTSDEKETCFIFKM